MPHRGTQGIHGRLLGVAGTLPGQVGQRRTVPVVGLEPSRPSWTRAALVSDGANNRTDPGCNRSSSAAQQRCRLPVASSAITGLEASQTASSRSRPNPSRDTGNDIGSTSNPDLVGTVRRSV
jgi:hypothetical protein